VCTTTCSGEYGHVISDIRFKKVINKQIEFFDSTVISLFQDILKCVGCPPSDGKRKGGSRCIPLSMSMKLVPKMIWFSSAATSDHLLLKRITHDANTIYVFDKDPTIIKRSNCFVKKEPDL
jgi:hypothetical protein